MRQSSDNLRFTRKVRCHKGEAVSCGKHPKLRSFNGIALGFGSQFFFEFFVVVCGGWDSPRNVKVKIVRQEAMENALSRGAKGDPRAEARAILNALRGAKAPLFHGSVGSEISAASFPR